MRIAVFIKSTTFHKDFGGLETQNKVLCEGLASRGHEIVVFSQKKELTETEKEQNNVKYVFIDSTYMYLFSGVNKKSWFNMSWQAFNTENTKRAFDIVLSQSASGYGIIARKKDLDIRVVSIAHGSVIGEFKTLLSTISIKNIRDIVLFLRNLQYVFRQFFGRQRNYVHGSNKVVAVSNAVKMQLIEETFVNEDKIEVINNGINEQKFLNGAGNVIETPGFNILYVGQITKDKGIDYLLDLICDARVANVVLNLVGDGSYMNELKSRVNNMPLNSNVVNIYGKLPYEEVNKIFLSSNIKLFVFPTRRVEGLPMVLVEALFSGIPVVAFDLGGVSDVVINNKTGLLVPANDINAFIDSLNRLKTDEELRSRFAKSSKELALKNFTIDVMLDKYEKVFSEVLN